MWWYEREYLRPCGATILVCLALLSTPAIAQMGPIQHSGFLEYQYRSNQGEEISRTSIHNGSWRTNAATWFWRPYILRLFGDLGLTRTTAGHTASRQESTLITGGISALVFSRSRFPFRIYFEQRDSRSESGPIDSDLAHRSWGFAQQLTTNRLGNYALEYKNSDQEDLYVDGVRELRQTNLELWQLRATKGIGRNQLDFVGDWRDLSRNTFLRAEERTALSLRHRFRSSSRFFIEDMTYFSDETILYETLERTRQLFQFNGRSTWQPATERPLRVIGRVNLRAIESGTNGFESSVSSASLAGTAVYQVTRRLSLAGNVALVNTMPEEGKDSSSVLSRLRADFRGDNVDLGQFRYDWGASAEVGNRRQRSHGEDTVQDWLVSLDHGLSRNQRIGVNQTLNFSAIQRVSTRADTLDRSEESLSHTLAASLTGNKGRTSSYVRLSATDRRSTGTRENTFQLVTLQASSRMQVSRKRSWNGSVSIQYSSNSQDAEDQERTAGSAVSFGANLSYSERDLFNVRNLDFMSELRMLSSEFRNDDMFDRATETLDERESNFWRNRLLYRIGQLELQLNANVREVSGKRASTVYLLIRRYYGGV